MTQVAGALLAVSLTSSPPRIAGLLAAQQLPWVLGALPAGALVNRVDRRRAMAAACLARAAALGTLGLLVAAGRAGLPVMYLVFLVTGAAGVVYENAATAIVPVLVARPELTRAYGRLQAASSLSRSLLAQPLGAWLFTVAPWVPFLLDTAGLLLVTVITSTLPRLARTPPPPDAGAAGSSSAPASDSGPGQHSAGCRAPGPGPGRPGPPGDLAGIDARGPDLAGRAPRRCAGWPWPSLCPTWGWAPCSRCSCCSPGSGWAPARLVTACSWP